MSRSLLSPLAALALVFAGGLTCWGGQGVQGPPRPTTANDLYLAARTGDLEAVRAAVAAGANVNEVLCYWGVDSGREQETPLFAAAAAGHTEVVRYLLEAGADPDIRCLEDGTALTIAAARAAPVEVLRLLLDAGADTLGPRPCGTSALGWSALKGDPESFLLLLDVSRREGIEPEEESSILKDSERRADSLGPVIGRLLTWKPETVPPLHVAARSGTLAEVEALLSRGESASGADEQGWTALHWAVFAESSPKTRLLLAAGADPSAKTQGGCTPLMLAARLADPQLAAILLDAGADLDAGDEDGRTALHVAAWNAGPEMLWLLLDCGADSRATDLPPNPVPECM